MSNAAEAATYPTLTHEQKAIAVELAALFSLNSLSGIDWAIKAGTTDLTIREVIEYAHSRQSGKYGFTHTAAKIARFIPLDSISEGLSVRMADHNILAALRGYRPPQD